MAKEITYEEIARDLKNRVYKPVYYLMGEESYYIDRISDYIAQTVLTDEEKEELSEIVADGKVFPVECQFCDTVYTFTPEDVAELLKKV